MDEELKESFEDKLGELPRVAELQLKPDAAPVVMLSRKLPVVVSPQLTEERDRLIKISAIILVKNPHVRLASWY